MPYQCRFLFSVTELSYSYNYTPYYDHLNNQLPPRSPLEFGPKAPGKVFRYNNGDISEATGFFPGVPYYSPDDESWRPSTIGYYTDRVLGADGEVVRLAERTWIPQECYSTVTMYNCGPFAPCLFKHGDASNSEDPLSSSFGDFRMMHFILEGGVSRASTNGGLRKVAGNSPTWIGSLVPETYNDRKTGQVSTGLGGELPLVIGLMALAQDVGRCDRAFTEPKWTRNRWVGRRNPTGCKFILVSRILDGPWSNVAQGQLTTRSRVALSWRLRLTGEMAMGLYRLEAVSRTCKTLSGMALL